MINFLFLLTAPFFLFLQESPPSPSPWDGSTRARSRAGAGSSAGAPTATGSWASAAQAGRMRRVRRMWRVTDSLRNNPPPLSPPPIPPPLFPALSSSLTYLNFHHYILDLNAKHTLCATESMSSNPESNDCMRRGVKEMKILYKQQSDGWAAWAMGAIPTLQDLLR